CAAISSLRGSTMSESAPAGKVSKNSGRVVATWTAETIIGSGLRLVINQLVDVSNMATPTFDIELAARMTMNARLANTPHRTSPPADPSNSALDSLDTDDLKRKWVAGRRTSVRRIGHEQIIARFQGAATALRRPEQRQNARDGQSYLIDALLKLAGA